MIASLADHGIARARRGRTPAGRGVSGGRRRGVLLCAALAAAGCGLFGGPAVTVENRSPWPVDGLWVVSSVDSVRVPPLEPGASATVRARVAGEDLVLLRGRAGGRVLAPSLGTYVEAAGGYRVRAVVDSAGAVTIVETAAGRAGY